MKNGTFSCIYLALRKCFNLELLSFSSQKFSWIFWYFTNSSFYVLSLWIAIHQINIYFSLLSEQFQKWDTGARFGFSIILGLIEISNSLRVESSDFLWGKATVSHWTSPEVLQRPNPLFVSVDTWIIRQEFQDFTDS